MFYPLEIRPRDRDTFNAALSIEQLGIAAVIRTFSSAAVIERSPRHVRGSERHAALLMSVKSVVRVVHGGHDVQLEEGDLLLTDSAMPSRMTFGHDNTSLGLLLPYETLRRYLPDPEAMFGRRVTGGHGFGPLVGTMLRAIWAHVEQGLPPLDPQELSAQSPDDQRSGSHGCFSLHSRRRHKSWKRASARSESSNGSARM